MIRDFVTVPITQSDFPDFNVPCEHLVEVATLAMCLSAWVYRRGEVERPQLLNDVTVENLDVLVAELQAESNRRMSRVPSLAGVGMLVLAAFQHPPLRLCMVWKDQNPSR
jgi:hypothetical protein